MSAFIVFLAILFISSIGFAVLRGFKFLSQKDTLLAIGASYGLGVGLVGLQLYLYFKFNIPWQKEFVLVPWVLMLGILILRKRNHIQLRLPKIPTLRSIDILLLLGILLAICYVVFEALLRPVVAWDAWANWLLYSKMFFFDGKITLETLHYTNLETPMTISLLGSFMYIMLGRIDDSAVLLTSTAFYVFLAITFFAVLKKRYGVRYALLFTFLLVTTQNFVRHGGRLEAGLADLPIGYYAFLSVVFLFAYFKNHAAKTLLILNVFLITTTLIKFEGIPLNFFITLCAFIYMIKHRLFKHIFIVFLWVVPYIFWQLDRRLMGLGNTFFSIHHFEISFKKSFNAFNGTFKELVNLKTWNVLWITYFYSLFAFGIRKQRELAVLHFVILSQLSLYLIMYNLTARHNPESSIERLLLHIAPLAFYSIAIVFKIIFSNKKSII